MFLKSKCLGMNQTKLKVMYEIYYLQFMFFGSTTFSYAYPSGISGKLLMDGGCGVCHGASSSKTIILILSKLGAFVVKPWTMLELTAAVAHPSKLAAGIIIVVKSSPNSNANNSMLHIVVG